MNLVSGSTVTSVLTGSAIPKIDAEAALDSTELAWFSGGEAVWIEDAAPGAVNDLALRSGAVLDNQASLLLFEVEGPGILTFNWKVSSEYSYDYLVLIVDDTVINGITGETAWLQRTVNLGPGKHRINWLYIKDYSISIGADAAWVDNVVWKRTE